MTLCFEQTLFTRNSTLRINAVDPQGDANSAILFQSIVNNRKQELQKNISQVFKSNPLNNVFSSTGDLFASITNINNNNNNNNNDVLQTKDIKAMKLLKKIVTNLEKVSTSIAQSSFTMISQQISDLYTVFANQSTDKLVGDVVVLWLLTRGCILIEMNRIFEAVMMFKLIETLKVQSLFSFCLYLFHLYI